VITRWPIGLLLLVSTVQFSGLVNAGETSTVGGKTLNPKKRHRDSSTSATQVKPQELKLGMSRQDVRAVLGGPDSIETDPHTGAEVWDYHRSTVTITHGKVTGWTQDPSGKFLPAETCAKESYRGYSCNEGSSWMVTTNDLAGTGSRRGDATFRVGDFTYTVTKCTSLEGFWGDRGVGQLKAPGGVKYVCVTFKIRNDSGSTCEVLTEGFKLQDAQGNTYSRSSEVTTALLMNGYKQDLLFSEVQPGIPKWLITGFEVPEAALSQPMSLIVPENGFFGTGQVVIPLHVTPINGGTL
jgi:hypothetical protein